jgi:hypothetical protein
MEYDKRKPIWERQKGETTKAYYQFCLYRDYGVDRSLYKVFDKSKRNGKGSQNRVDSGQKMVSLKQATGLCSKFEWVKRVSAYDDYIEKSIRKKREQDIMKMRERYAISGKKSQEYAEALRDIGKTVIVKKYQQNPENFNLSEYGISLADARELEKHAMKLERFGLGDTEETKEVTHIEKPESQNDGLERKFLNASDEDKRSFADLINNMKKKN